MDISGFMNSDVFAWVILPILIFISRILDQSIGTLRLIFLAKGFKSLTLIFAFFESLIWLIAVMQIIKHLDNVLCYVFYAGGFATGNYVGILLEERLSIGTVVIRVICKDAAGDLINALRKQGYGVTSVDMEGMKGKVKMFLTIVHRKEAKSAIDIINQKNPNAFYTIEEVRSVKEGYFKGDRSKIFSITNPFNRKSK